MAVADYLNELINQKTQLADNINKMGVSAESSEKFNTLVPKVLKISGGSGGSGGVDEIEVMNCKTMTSSTEVFNAHTGKIKVSNDGSFESWEELGDYVYNSISTVYTNSTAGIDLKASKANCGFYYVKPISTSSSDVLLRLSYYVSTWITPEIVINFIDSKNDIETAISSNNFALSKSLTLAPALNNDNFYSEVELPVGDYYVFVSIPSATGGNDAVLSSIDLLCL